jgi:hypothetical protein
MKKRDQLPAFKKLNFAALARTLTRLITKLFDSDEIPEDNQKKLQRRKFIDKWIGIRLIYDNITNNLLNLYSTSVEARKMYR